jgi:hypothetical protein
MIFYDDLRHGFLLLKFFVRVDHPRGAGFLGSTPLITYAFDSSTAWLKKAKGDSG